jgi:riboflavin kinase/FMN adenylyltransferase
MKLIENLDDIRTPFRKAVVTIGNFDGVHIGHQALFHAVIEKADTIDGTSVAMTFHPHPVRVLQKNDYPPLITLYDQKVELIARSGIDALVCVPFTLEFSQISAKQFVLDVLLERLGMTAIVVGKDYTFGRNREGTLNSLMSYAELYDFEVVVVDWVPMSGHQAPRISSTRIRELVMDGNVKKAAKLLGRHYQLRGTVAHGRNRGGKLLGFATANLNLQDELCPKLGIYAVTVAYQGSLFNGVANIGYSPTFDDNEFTVEVHILDFDADIYGQEIRVNFVDRIRDEIKFASVEELSRQIKRDVQIARDLLA